MSVDGHDVSCNDRRPLASVLEATTTLVDDTFGDVKGGIIRLKCALPFLVTVEELDPPHFNVRLRGLTFFIGCRTLTERDTYNKFSLTPS